MELEQKEAALLDKAIAIWQQENIIDEQTAIKMKGSYSKKQSQVGVLSMYAFIAAVSCGLLAFGALVMDEKWIELLRLRLMLSEITVGIGFAILTAVFVYFSARRRKRNPGADAANETYNITVILSVAVTMAYLGRSLGYQNGNYAPILLLAAVVYGLTAFWLHSRLLWAALLLTIAGWWGAQTFYWSNGQDYFGGMNYPLRMTVLGGTIVLLSFLMAASKSLFPFRKVTVVMGWMMFLSAAWSLSILGNSRSFETWLLLRQGQLWYWSLGYTLLLLMLIVYAFRKNDDFLRDLALVFFLVNIYTRYFEYFWDKTNKGLFFTILAISFWWVGKSAERWRKKIKNQ